MVEKIITIEYFWNEIVVLDYNEFSAETGNIRKAFHSAVSLYHFHDWIFNIHKEYIDKEFTYFNYDSKKHENTTKPKHFADALEQREPHFGTIRRVANSFKHLALTPTKVPKFPENAAQTRSQPGAFQNNAFQPTAVATPTVMIQTATGYDLPFIVCAAAVHAMWIDLRSKHGW